MNHQFRVEFRKVKDKGLRSPICLVTKTAEVVLWAKDSVEAISLATRSGGVATKANVCCVTRVT